ncbi:AbrB family transcriptional regulator [Fusibacter bizertensis]|uniref:AbrB family transcriptional regulator n=1 Tax=Fusibacter bizertensis TaxID=1488331 RepID=A0ABT6NGQ0_9FIRM|nr:AbrB family transcriptional regulator [Fusibacter bizertensis]MDH8679586.1 AbrB family transcriptional regulator [Fusibacter bizertensis]
MYNLFTIWGVFQTFIPSKSIDFIFSFVLIILISFAGYKFLEILKFPASKIVGPILAIALVQLTGITFEIPSIFKTVFSIVFGIFLGLRFDKKAVKQLRKLAIPTIVISLVYIFITLGYGELLMRISDMDQNTSFLSVIPGGVAESGVLAVSYGADLAQVSAFQLLRYLSIVMIIPLLTKTIIIKVVNSKSNTSTKSDMTLNNQKFSEDFTPLNTMRYAYYWLFIVGIFGAMLFKWLRFPAALLLGAAFGVAILQLSVKSSFKKPPQAIYGYSQIGMGAVIGTSFTLESMRMILSLWFPMLVMTTLILTTSIILGFVFSKLFKLDYLTGLMSVLPGGLSTMIVLAEDFDVNIVTISTLQLARLLTAVMVIPILYTIILG